MSRWKLNNGAVIENKSGDESLEIGYTKKNTTHGGVMIANRI